MDSGRDSKTGDKRKAATRDDVQKALALERELFGEQADVFGEDSAAGAEDHGEDGILSPPRKANSIAAKKKAVWVDPEDEKLQVNIGTKSRNKKLQKKQGETVISGVEYEKRLRAQHRKLNAKTDWAVPASQQARGGGNGDGDGDGDGDEDLPDILRKAGSLLAKGRKQLKPGLIDMTRCKDANLHGPTKGVIRSIQFHPNRQLLLTAGMDKTLRLFQVDGIRNPSVQNVFLEDCPIHQAAFSGNGRHVVATGRRPHFYVFDLAASKVERVAGLMGFQEKSLESFAMSPSLNDPLMAFMGNQGTIPLVSLKSRQPVGSLKISGDVRCLSFTPCGQQLLAGGTDGMVYLFDLRNQQCIGCQVDEGSLKGTALLASPDGATFASGSDSGVVNLYTWDGLRGSGQSLAPAAVKPEKALMNLTTTVDSLAYSPDGNVLAMASRMKKDALRLVHVPSRTVFSNWPSGRTPLHYVHCMAFSPGGGYLAVGNAKGKALLYRLHHYSEA